MKTATCCEVGARHDYLHKSGRLLAAEKKSVVYNTCIYMYIYICIYIRVYM